MPTIDEILLILGITVLSVEFVMIIALFIVFIVIRVTKDD